MYGHLPSKLHSKVLGMRNLQYEMRICQFMYGSNFYESDVIFKTNFDTRVIVIDKKIVRREAISICLLVIISVTAVIFFIPKNYYGNIVCIKLLFKLKKKTNCY